MSKILKYSIGFAVVLLVLYFSLDLQKLDDYKSLDSERAFNLEHYVAETWETKFPGVIASAPDLAVILTVLDTDPNRAFQEYGKKLGISKTWYFIAKSRGAIEAVEDEYVVVKIAGNKQVHLATAFIFGNAVRDGSGVVDIDDFVNMTDFNNVSIALNTKVKEEIIPGLLKIAAPGVNIEFTGAFEINEEKVNTNNIRIIPLSVKVNNGDS